MGCICFAIITKVNKALYSCPTTSCHNKLFTENVPEMNPTMYLLYISAGLHIFIPIFHLYTHDDKHELELFMHVMSARVGYLRCEN